MNKKIIIIAVMAVVAIASIFIVIGKNKGSNTTTKNDTNINLKKSGLYGDGKLKETWDGLLKEEDLRVENGKLYGENVRLTGDLVIDSQVSTIGEKAFYTCYTIYSVTIPESVKTIEKSAFQSCINLMDVKLPSKIIKIDEETFRNCTNLMNISIPNSVTSIESKAFYDCSNLETVTIPSSVKNIAKDAFTDCKKLDNKTKSKILEIQPNAEF